MRIRGIDVSGYNKITNYAKAKSAGVEFAIIKVIRKDGQPDKLFETHWKGFEGVGIPIQGVYNYSYATSVEKAMADARRVIEVLNGRHTMVWLDIEDECLRGKGHLLIDIIKAYAEVIHSAGHRFGIYTFVSFWKENLRPYASELDYPFWVARYPSTAKVKITQVPDMSKCPNIGKSLHGWQYSSTGQIDGIIGDVDLDEWYVDIEARASEKVIAEPYGVASFRCDLAVSLGLPATATPHNILDKTVTISTAKNKTHASVTALEHYLRAKGYYNGIVEAEHGEKPRFGQGMLKATILYQSQIVGLKKPDGVWTEKNLSYKKALGII